jgi:hypothetical protein
VRAPIRTSDERPPFSQREIVLGAPAFIAVTFNRNRPRGVLFEHGGIAIKHALTLGREIAAVEFEEYRS